MKIDVHITLNLEVPDKTALASDTRILLENIVFKLEEFENKEIDLGEWCEMGNTLKGSVNITPINESTGTYKVESVEDVINIPAQSGRSQSVESKVPDARFITARINERIDQYIHSKNASRKIYQKAQSGTPTHISHSSIAGIMGKVAEELQWDLIEAEAYYAENGMDKPNVD